MDEVDRSGVVVARVWSWYVLWWVGFRVYTSVVDRVWG